MIEYKKSITREYVRKNPHKTFLFGDNVMGEGLGGQAKEMRGEPNAVGIPTKKKPSMSDDSFFTDDEIILNTICIDLAFKQVYKLANKIIVIPEDGLGTGLAQLPKRAPKTYAYLQNILETLE